jgi:hypothetical protein
MLAQSTIAAITPADVALFALFLVLVFLGLMWVLLYNAWKYRLRDSPSPYTKLPLRRGSEISYSTAVKILRFLYDLHQYDNRIFDLKRAAVCRETGRIFPEAVTWYEVIKSIGDFYKNATLASMFHGAA